MSKSIHESLLRKSNRRFNDLYELFKENGELTLVPRDNGLFEYMARLVAGQQLSGKAARTIWSRVEMAVGESGADLSNFCCSAHSTTLRSCGLSAKKVKALVGLRQSFLDGSISENDLLGANHFQVSKAVTSIWGFGEWSADMVALSFCWLPDVWSSCDTSLQRGIHSLSGGDADRMNEILECFVPHRSYLALHIWKGIDTRRI